MIIMPTVTLPESARRPAVTSTGGNIMSIIKVSARSRTASVAGAIAGVMREAGLAEVQAIRAGAVNHAVKAIIMAGVYLS